jgi:hypothetical protein
MTLPNFLVIGAQKAGTTSLYHYLAQHPQVYMSPIKEPCFFNHEIDPDGKVVEEGFGNPGQRTSRISHIEEYRALFRGVNNETAIGEASPPYIYVPGTAERIKRYVPEARVIAVLRNPADRAYSAFLHAVRIGKEPLTDFVRALLEEETRVRENWHYTFHYRSRGFYYAQLRRYYRVFGWERVGIWLYEDLRKDPVGVAQGIFRFLGVDDTFVPNTSSKHNVSGVPKGETARATIRAMDTLASAFLETFTSESKIYPLLSKVRHRVQSRIVTKPPALDSKTRAELTDSYREDILKLQELIGKDLSAWLIDGDRTLASGVNLFPSTPGSGK